jgi:chromosome segregation ATPase
VSPWRNACAEKSTAFTGSDRLPSACAAHQVLTSSAVGLAASRGKNTGIAIAVTATRSPRLPLAAWGPLQDAASQFREECAAWEQATHNLFSDLDRLREELSTKAQALDDGRRRLAERGRQLADQRKEANRLAQLLEQQETRLAEALTELRGLREQLDQERDDSRRREDERTETLQSQVNALNEQIARLQTERDELKTLLSLAQAEGGATSAQVVEPLLKHFADLKHSMDSTRSELSGAIERVVGRVAERPAGGAGPPLGAKDLVKMQALEKEHVELESELELVRARAAELQELVQQLKRELVEQRSGMTDELRELRRMLGQQAEAPPHREGFREPPAEGFAESRPEGRPAMTMTLPAREVARENVRDSVPLSATADAATHAVMAQFAKLQKDVASRRKKK